MMVSGPGQKRRASMKKRSVNSLGQFFRHHGVADQEGQRAVRLAALGLEDLRHGAQVERVGHQRVQRVGGDRDHFAAAHGGGGTLQRFRLGLLGIDLDQVGCH